MAESFLVQLWIRRPDFEDVRTSCHRTGAFFLAENLLLPLLRKLIIRRAPVQLFLGEPIRRGLGLSISTAQHRLHRFWIGIEQ